jgi:hypothetical protein
MADDKQKRRAGATAAGGSTGLLAAEATPQSTQSELQSAAPEAPQVNKEDVSRASDYARPDAPYKAASDPDAAMDKGGKDLEYFAKRADTEQQRIDPTYKALRGMFDSDPMPEFQKAGLDASTQGLIEGQDARASQDERQIVAERLAGTEYGKEALNKAMEGQQASELGLGGQKSFLEAIQRRVGKGFDRELNTMKQRAQIGAGEEKFNRMAQVMQTKSAQAQIQKRIADAEYVYKRNVQAAKNKMLGSVLGLAGMAIGGAMAGPQGASAGSQASGLAGNQSEGTM